MSRPLEIIQETETLLDMARARQLTGPEQLEDWMRDKMSEADSLETAYAQPVIQLMLQKNMDDLFAVQQALVLADPTHSALIGALQARAMWHQQLPTWLRQTIDGVRQHVDDKAQIETAENYVD